MGTVTSHSTLLVATIFCCILATGSTGSRACEQLSQNVPCYRYFQNAIVTANDQSVINVTSFIRNHLDGKRLESFLCVTSLEPCGISKRLLGVKSGHVTPCRKFCQVASHVWKKYRRLGNIPNNRLWPPNVRCSQLPESNCVIKTDYDEWKYITRNQEATSPLNNFHKIPLLPDNDAELAFNHVTTACTDHHARRYDVKEHGHAQYFRGWADVQGQGAANDYCRVSIVIGNPQGKRSATDRGFPTMDFYITFNHRRPVKLLPTRVLGQKGRLFMACALAGSSGHHHSYVSQKGLEVGVSGTWYMRDMDDDGRDDYCRCVGNMTESFMVCMKAHRKGFASSPFVGGSQFSFRIPNSSGCFNRKYDPFFGLPEIL